MGVPPRGLDIRCPFQSVYRLLETNGCRKVYRSEGITENLVWTWNANFVRLWFGYWGSKIFQPHIRTKKKKKEYWVPPLDVKYGSYSSFIRMCLRGYCTSGPYFWRLCAFSQKIKQLRTKYPMDLVRNVPRNSKITVLLQ